MSFFFKLFFLIHHLPFLVTNPPQITILHLMTLMMTVTLTTKLLLPIPFLTLTPLPPHHLYLHRIMLAPVLSLKLPLLPPSIIPLLNLLHPHPHLYHYPPFNPKILTLLSSLLENLPDSLNHLNTFKTTIVTFEQYSS
jgi:hypothetical protein